MQRGRCARLAITIARPKACNSGIGERIEPAPFEKPSFQEDAMNQNEKAKRFAELHVKGAPLLLYNAWDAGSAKSILEAGAPAIATSLSRRHKGIETARPSRSNSPSRSSGGSQRPSRPCAFTSSAMTGSPS